MKEYVCARKLHLWANAEDAFRCCNGHIRLWAPFLYGESKTAGGALVPRSDWYRPGRLWKMVLIPEENTEEIERLLALSPPDLKSSTTQNAWLKLPQ